MKRNIKSVSLILLILIFLGFNSFAQTPFFIKIKYPKDLGDSLKCTLIQINDLFYIKKFVYFLKDSITYFENGKDSNITICRYEIPNNSNFAFIADGGAKHEIVIIPNDTLKITTSLFNKANWAYQVVPKKWHYVYNFEGKNEKLNSFSDSIFLKFNVDLYNSPPPSLESNNIDSIFRAIIRNYQSCFVFMKDYCTRYNIADSIYEREKSNLISQYIMTLSTYRTKYPESFNLYLFNQSDVLLSMKVIDKIKTDSTLFFDNYVWRGMVHAYLTATYYKNYSDTDEELKYIGKYGNIEKFIVNKTIKEYLLAEHLINFAKYHYLRTDSLKQEFSLKYPNSIYLNNIDLVINNNNYANLDSTLKVIEISDQKNNNMSLFNLLEKSQRPVFIDFWATWCKPCLAEMKYSHEFETMYRNKIDFIYISMDDNKEAWIKYLNLNHLVGNQYLLQENFKSKLAKRFSISSIPRYILFEKSVKLISAHAPRPGGQRKELIKLLDKLLDK